MKNLTLPKLTQLAQNRPEGFSKSAFQARIFANRHNFRPKWVRKTLRVLKPHKFWLLWILLLLPIIACGNDNQSAPSTEPPAPPRQAEVNKVASPAPQPTLTVPAPASKQTKPTSSPSAATAQQTPPAEEGFIEDNFWAALPLPDDADLVPVVEGVDLAFATALSEPEIFDAYAEWLTEQGWQQQAPTQAQISAPGQRWQKDVAEFSIEIPGQDAEGRALVWLQISYPSTDAPPHPAPAPSPPAAAPSGAVIAPHNAQLLTVTRQLQLDFNATDLAWSPKGNLLALTTSSATPSRLYLYNAATLTPIALPQQIEANRLAFSPDGAYLAVSRQEGMSNIRVDLWRVADWSLAHTLDGHLYGITHLAWSPDGSLLATASMDGSVKLWQMADGSLAQEWPVTYQGYHRPGVLSVAFSPDGANVAAGVYGGSIQGWPTNSLTQTINFQASGLPQPNQALFLPDGRLLSLNGYTVNLWQPDGVLLKELQSERQIAGGTLSPAGDLLAACALKSLEFWDMNTLEFCCRKEIGGAQAIYFSPDGAQLAVLKGDEKLLQVWEVAQ